MVHEYNHKLIKNPKKEFIKKLNVSSFQSPIFITVNLNCPYLFLYAVFAKFYGHICIGWKSILKFGFEKKAP